MADISLTPMTNVLYHQYCQAYENDPDLYMDMAAFKPYQYTFDAAEAYMQRKQEKQQLVFAIMENGLPVGEILLKEIDREKKVCTLGICLQNDAAKNRGIGTKAEQLILQYAFDELGMETVYADAILKNTRSQRVLEKVGFHQIRQDAQFRYYQINHITYQGARTMDAMIAYLKTKYTPLGMILYGSYADGTQDGDSDFDALLILPEGPRQHDVSMVHGVQLDVFCYPLSDVTQEIDPNEFLQILDGKVIFDAGGAALGLLHRVADHVQSLPRMSEAEVREALAWCRKMLTRTRREDAEGYYRWHWLLTESLEILFDVLGQPYLGPKKSLRWLQSNAPQLLEYYHRALREMDIEALAAWIDRISALAP